MRWPARPSIRRDAHTDERCSRHERGQSLVEFAMVLPLLLVLLFGIVDFGRAFQSWISITNAAREGARVGTTGATATTICARVEATAAVSGATCTVTGVPGMTGDNVTVKVDYTLSLITPIGPMLGLLGGQGLQSSFPLTSTAIMRIE
jgi:Flp pilus assembly protein TadG